jgi:hypothetical protein
MLPPLQQRNKSNHNSLFIYTADCSLSGGVQKESLRVGEGPLDVDHVLGGLGSILRALQSFHGVGRDLGLVFVQSDDGGQRIPRLGILTRELPGS